MRGRTTLRAAGVVISLGLIVLWVLLVRYIFERADQIPAPAAFMLPLFFFSLAAWAGVAAFRDEPMLMVVAGGLSLVPVGLFLLFMPGFARWIGILDVCVVALGVVLLRWPREEDDGVSPVAAPGG